MKPVCPCRLVPGWTGSGRDERQTLIRFSRGRANDLGIGRLLLREGAGMGFRADAGHRHGGRRGFTGPGLRRRPGAASRRGGLRPGRPPVERMGTRHPGPAPRDLDRRGGQDFYSGLQRPYRPGVLDRRHAAADAGRAEPGPENRANHSTCRRAWSRGLPGICTSPMDTDSVTCTG